MYSQIWHYIEIGLISIVIIFQLIHTIKVEYDISLLSNIFRFKLFLRNGFIERDKIGKVDLDSPEVYYKEEEIGLDSEVTEIELSGKLVNLSLVETEGDNYIINKIKKSINTYLINNFGAAVNFSIIKDIIDREVDVKDEEITQSITFPLYLGLASTMIGIIFGLFSMPVLNGNGFSYGINALIGGVKIAMIGSLTGLICTTYLSSFSYKKAKRIVQRDINEQFSYLQAKLLPELIRAEDTGVSGLKASLDKFARVATNIFDNVLIAAKQTGENLELQKEFIEKVDNLKVLKVSKWNLELFDRMESNLEAMKQFSDYVSNMEQIASNLLEFSSKTSDVNRVINDINTTLSESKKLFNFLSSHLEIIENSGDVALKSVGLAESHFEESIKLLNERTEEMIKQLYKSAGNHEIKLESIYKDIEGNLNGIANQYIGAFRDAFSDSIPKFKQLDNLDLIKDINTSLNSMVNNQPLFNKLNSIEANIIRRNGNNNKKNLDVNTALKVETKDGSKPISFRKVLKKIF